MLSGVPPPFLKFGESLSVDLEALDMELRAIGNSTLGVPNSSDVLGSALMQSAAELGGSSNPQSTNGGTTEPIHPKPPAEPSLNECLGTSKSIHPQARAEPSSNEGIVDSVGPEDLFVLPRDTRIKLYEMVQKIFGRVDSRTKFAEWKLQKDDKDFHEALPTELNRHDAVMRQIISSQIIKYEMQATRRAEQSCADRLDVIDLLGIFQQAASLPPHPKES
ncbi:hypothetical protein PGTUg99_025554 [Puccinia graminis f. sp. tritici]|uniref:Uncharacterized protein n=1 Tax=Puccinia graminis f. sp. tritici TaxID=56615 RepID=A0A5B0MYX2_PUCGR|nr:hypothetical protein PGTUg99_025554 [Puccinia graminis f. sp. tritici]